MNLCYGVFCKYLCDFRVQLYVWEEIVFPKVFVKLREISNIKDLVKFRKVLKLEFVVNN